MLVSACPNSIPPNNRRASTHTHPQEMALILWAFAKVQWGDNGLFGMVARELMWQTNTGVVGVVGGGGELLGGIGKDPMESCGGVLIFDLLITSLHFSQNSACTTKLLVCQSHPLQQCAF